MDNKMIIYQLLPRLFGNTNENCIPNGNLSENGTGKFSDISEKVLIALKKLSISHIWYTGIIEHSMFPDEGAKGLAGSPYAVKDYYDVNSYLADNPSERMTEFEALVSRTKKVGLGVLLDFIPNHVAVSYKSDIAKLKGYKDFEDKNFFEGRIHDGDWTDTVKLNYHHPDTWDKMTDILLYWASKGISGFRCDMVELVTPAFWERTIPRIKSQYPDIIFIAEIYQKENYWKYINAGFDYLYDKSGLYDTLRAISTSGWSASEITRCWQETGDLQPKMLYFLENHDEQRLASDFFLGDARKALPLLYVSLFFNTSSFMHYFGQEFGEKGMDHEGFSSVDGRTSIFDFWSLSCIRRWLKGVRANSDLKYLTSEEKAIYKNYVRLYKLASTVPAFYKGKTFDLQYVNPTSSDYNNNRQFSFLRCEEKELYLCVVNFDDNHVNLKINIPKDAFDYFEIEQDEQLYSNKPIEVSVDANNGILVRLK
ncbi:MAG: alpha-amylase family glycosyl hydrolase [Bacteroidales bacterium]